VPADSRSQIADYDIHPAKLEQVIGVLAADQNQLMAATNYNYLVKAG
jgi:hypothetical protein